MGQYDNTPVISRAFRTALQAFLPPPDLLPSEWAERNVKIPAGNAVPGLIRFDNAPYQREPMDMLVNPDCHRITLQWAAQVGKTQLALCGQAYHIEMRPMSQMMMQPSEADLKTWLAAKFQPLIDSNPALQARIAKPRAREGVNNQQMKSYPGGFLMFAWSGSPKTMRGRSAPLIVVDEVDGYEVTPEGHPVSLIWQRAATFGDQRKLLEISTPTVRGTSYIEAAYKQGDQRRFHVPCPDCGAWDWLRWENVRWDGRDDEDAEQQPETARYCCPHCGSMWDDGQRKAAIRAGKWVAALPFHGHASYHLSEMYSTFRRLQDIVRSYLEKRAANDIQTFVNVSLAETWEEQGEKADRGALQARAEHYAAQVPMGGLVLTAGVDMQPDRLECEVVAWGVGDESWSVDYQVFWGDVLTDDPWLELEAFLSSSYQHESGAQLTISSACVDTGGTGGSTQAAYEWLRGKTGRRIFGIKGIPGWGRPVVAAPSRKITGQRRRPIDLFLVGVDEAKLMVMRRLGIPAPGPGYCHFPITRAPEWYEQLTAETLITRMRRGFPVREWHKTAPRNEALDCRVYALAALKISAPSMRRAQQRINEALAARVVSAGADGSDAPGKPASAPLEAPDGAETETPQRDTLAEAVNNARSRNPRARGRKRRGGWVNNW